MVSQDVFSLHYIYKRLINDQTVQQHDKHQEDRTSRRKATPHEEAPQDSPKTQPRTVFTF